MKPRLAKLKPELERETRRAIEEFAKAELKPDIVRVRMYEAARQGQVALRLRLPDGMNVDMRETEAAAQLAQWCEDNGLKLTWESRMADLADGRRVTVYEPEISWQAALL
jgi:hypothetical protein